jgi:hypothetical protein
MKMPSFSVSIVRNIRLASRNRTWRIMMITRPIGCGKSTILDTIREDAANTDRVLYIGPHTSNGSKQVRLRNLSGTRLSMYKVHAERVLSSYNRISIHSSSRSAWDLDETGSYLNYSLRQMKLDRQSTSIERFEHYSILHRSRKLESPRYLTQLLWRNLSSSIARGY